MTQTPENANDVRELVQDRYGQTARTSSSCCGQGASKQSHAESIGYDKEQLDGVPEEANLGLGCGNPTALASLKPGEVVVDLGSGGGLDALIAAKAVGKEGRVIGIDMTPDMLARARKAAVDSGVADRVEFREGIIEQLPVVDDSVDVIISNCVVNLSPEKGRVFKEAFRVLKPGGRLAVSDILLSEPLPEDIAKLAAAYVGCVGGAIVAEEYFAAMREAGFEAIEHDRVSAASMIEGALADPMVKAVVEGLGVERVKKVAQTVYSYKIRARKP